MCINRGHERRPPDRQAYMGVLLLLGLPELAQVPFFITIHLLLNLQAQGK